MTHANLDQCASEPIRIPGAIQPFGALIVVDPETFDCLHVSRNFAAMAGVDVAPGRSLRDEPALRALVSEIEAWRASGRTVHLGRVALGAAGLHLTGHATQQGLIVELEPPPPASPDVSLDGFYPRLRGFLDRIATAPDIPAVARAAVRDIREITGFNRVLLYSFDEDGDGAVLAEDGDGVLPSYLGLRFPASDIPAQARDLYKLNRIRLIADGGYAPCPVEPAISPVDGRPLDLSFAALRSVSPVHLEYMRNMGTGSSMSISIIVDGELWGLVSGHSRDPLRVHPQTRAACESLGQILSLQIEAHQRSERSADRLRLKEVETKLLSALAVSDKDFQSALLDEGESWMALARAAGAAMIVQGRTTSAGMTPPDAQIEALAAALHADRQEFFATDSLAARWPAAAEYADVASGMIAVSISQIRPDYVMWFRPEVVRTIEWSGDPTKPASADERLHPRKSFELWKELVRLRSLGWTPAERESAESFRSSIQNIVLRGAEERAELTDRLERVNKELESFSYSISHDLRAPFRHIVGYAELLSDREKGLDDKSQHYLRTISEAALSAGRLVDDLLNFSQLGRAGLVMATIDMRKIVSEMQRSLETEMEGRNIEWKIGALPRAWGDPAMLGQVVQNLLQNAIKYTRPRDPAVIAVSGEDLGDAVSYTISDNGVGFEMAYVGKLFGVFQRLHRAEEFEGTGIGLALVKRIVTRHGGTVTAHSAPDEGASFTFTLPKRRASAASGEPHG